ncbi:MAG: TetR family transcriptional regulator [Micromonosporaceae bacterium]|nr:TetR family transcriptional regulator [Micromonosporaceae bacterium]
MSTQSVSSVGPLRRVPVQGRSVARVQRMLDACAELVDEVGYEALSTTMLAERAGVAIGSVYQFFPDKRAIVQALTLRNIDAYLQRLSERLTTQSFAHWWEAVDAGIDEYIAMHREMPGFRTLHFGDVVDLHLLDPERPNNTIIAERLAILLADHFGAAAGPAAASAAGSASAGPAAASAAGIASAGPRLNFVLTIAVETADALTKLAFRRDPDGDPAVLAEAKALIREYLHRQVNVGVDHH